MSVGLVLDFRIPGDQQASGDRRRERSLVLVQLESELGDCAGYRSPRRSKRRPCLPRIGAELGATDVLVANTKQDCSDFLQSLGARP